MTDEHPKPLSAPGVRARCSRRNDWRGAFRLAGSCFACGVAIVWPVLECRIHPPKRPLASFDRATPPEPCRAAASQSSASSCRPNCRRAGWYCGTRPPSGNSSKDLARPAAPSSYKPASTSASTAARAATLVVKRAAQQTGRQPCWSPVLPHEGMLPGEWLSFHRGFEVPFIGSRGLWSCGRRVRRWATQGAQRRVVHGRARCAEGASSIGP